jgi:hypothetical protein
VPSTPICSVICSFWKASMGSVQSRISRRALSRRAYAFHCPSCLPLRLRRRGDARLLRCPLLAHCAPPSRGPALRATAGGTAAGSPPWIRMPSCISIGRSWKEASTAYGAGGPEASGGSGGVKCLFNFLSVSHSKLRAAIIPTPRQQSIDGDESKTAAPYWN